jgi:hypothetical protein
MKPNAMVIEWENKYMEKLPIGGRRSADKSAIGTGSSFLLTYPML